MRIGFNLPQFGTQHHIEEVARFAREAEGLGADSLWVSDRLLAPVNPVIGYAGGDDFPAVFRSIMDPFVLLTIAAGATERVQIGSNVLNAPWYPPAVLARSLTSIDVLSRGRLIVGLGSGWSPDEYQAVGVPMSERGKRLDECVEALIAMWTTNPAEFHGKFSTIPATHVELRPVQSPRPPVYFAAFAPASMRRLARYGDGWLAVTAPGAREFDPAALAGSLTLIRGFAEEEGRDPAEITPILRVYPTAAAGLEEIVECIHRAEQETDVEHVIVDLMYLITKGADHAIELTGRVLEMARAR